MRSTPCPGPVVLLLTVVMAVLGSAPVAGSAPASASASASASRLVSVWAAGSGSAAAGSGSGSASVPARPDRAEARWVWPTGSRVVERAWEAPSSDYSAGHRGLDVPASLGATAVAVADGTVAFAGAVGGRSVVTIDHGGGLVSTLDSAEPLVSAGDEVRQGDAVGRVAVGHCPAAAPCLHLGARVDGRYVDPMPYLPPAEWPVLLPESAWPG
ncbi:murein hydrolase activator EnvC family protein [Curtobacterium oceanosedimentum]|uniref:murein hydrolase activator EnvC family protein n=1 Tax=Curtobacterium oceanosedimentum TaxID=465820 RepID=UPI001CE21907|nr:M23 family metallopeptidase [Curtobacterium oceanosedimentum]MCA5923998.1 M23 family metallopeptidase [Curtobacterium oceanosedimentum]